MIDITLKNEKINKLFCDFHKMDVQLKNHRKGISRFSDEDFQKLLIKRWNYREVIMTLDLMNLYFEWCEEMGM